MAGERGNKWRQWNRACVDNSPAVCRSSFFWWMTKKKEKRKELYIVWCWHSLRRVLKYSRHTLWIIPTRTRIRQHERTRNCESQLLRNIFRWQKSPTDGKARTKTTFSHQFSLSRPLGHVLQLSSLRILHNRIIGNDEQRPPPTS